MPKQFWVIGGEYRDTDFHHLIDGTSQVYGPFQSYDDARTAWRERSVATRHQAMRRYTIAASAGLEENRAA